MGSSRRAVIGTAAVLVLSMCAGLLHAAAPRQHIMYLRAEPAVLNQRLAAFPATPVEQMQALRHQFDQIGYGTGLCQQQGSGRGLVCTVPGQGSAVVLVLAFLSRADRHRGTQIEQAPAVLLPLLAESAIGVERRATHIFAALESGGNEQAALRDLIDAVQGRGQRTVSAVVLISDVGRAEPIVGCVRRDSLLQRALAGSASTLGVEISADNLSPCPGVLKGLDATFADRRVLITSPGSKRVPNPAGFGQIAQELEALDPKAYYFTYQYLCTFLAYLDSSLGSGGAAVDDVTAELRACFEQARATRGLPAFATSEPLQAFARQRVDRLAAAAGTPAPEPDGALDQQLQASGYLAQTASEMLASAAPGERAQLCDALLKNRLVASPEPVALAIGAKTGNERIFAVAELAVPAAGIDIGELKRQVLTQIGDARRAAGNPAMERTDRSYLDSLACEVAAMKEPSADPVNQRLKREHKTAHVVLFQGRSATIPDAQLVTLRNSKDDEVSIGACRSPSSADATVVIVTDLDATKN